MIMKRARNGGIVVAKPENVVFNTKDITVYLAAAGCGKTTALMNEMTELLKTYRPDEIAFVTYTKKGVRHGKDRALRANPQMSVEDLAHFKTLHALCYRELGLKKESEINNHKVKPLNEAFGFKITLNEAFENRTEDDMLLERHHMARAGCPESMLASNAYNVERYNRLIPAYEAFKKRNNLVDFTDCLLWFRETGKPLGVKVAFIDEAQDLTPLQWEVCQIAFAQCEKIRIAGDDYQSLFTYSGASPATLIDLAQRYKCIKLEKSHRLPVSVHQLAKGITNLITQKIDKGFEPVTGCDGFVESIADNELLAHKILRDLTSNGNQSNRWYVLFRNNCLIKDVAKILERLVIPYHYATSFCLDERKLNEIQRYYNYRKKGYGSEDAFKKFCEKYNIKDINDDFTESEIVPSERRHVYFDYVQKYGIEALVDMVEKDPIVLLTTTHKVKGGEADNVAVLLGCTRKTYENRQVNMDDELRVVYVACTRAKQGLYLVAGRGSYGLDMLVDLAKEQAA